mmetsp:Transcript_39622/g.118981  ORF Transcript_39622/g.118981 Transcript_39622/m.118981 type:complete len:230 (+) Transcript_39622:1385-2074(+)
MPPSTAAARSSGDDAPAPAIAANVSDGNPVHPAPNSSTSLPRKVSGDNTDCDDRGRDLLDDDDDDENCPPANPHSIALARSMPPLHSLDPVPPPHPVQSLPSGFISRNRRGPYRQTRPLASEAEEGGSAAGGALPPSSSAPPRGMGPRGPAKNATLSHLVMGDARSMTTKHDEAGDGAGEPGGAAAEEREEVVDIALVVVASPSSSPAEEEGSSPPSPPPTYSSRSIFL